MEAPALAFADEASRPHEAASAHPSGEGDGGDAAVVLDAANISGHPSGEKNGGVVTETCEAANVRDVVGDGHLSAEELVAKCRAPVKREFVRAAGVRLPILELKVGAQEHGLQVEEDGVVAASAGKVSFDKKSKRQQKRERAQAKKSVDTLCSVVARMGDVRACTYGENCRFNHDVSSFLEQKAPDLPGSCPYLPYEIRCPFGLACRFAGSHVLNADSHDKIVEMNFVEGNAGEILPTEFNSLSRDFQKLLWKQRVSFVKADAQLKALGLLHKAKILASKETTLPTNQNEQCVNKVDSDSLDVNKDKYPSLADQVGRNDSTTTCISASSPPPKRAKSVHEGESVKENIGLTNDGPCNKKLDSADLAVSGKNNLQDEREVKLSQREKKVVNLKKKLIMAPLTTVGNLPFRRICKKFGAEVTCGEMAMCTNLLQGKASEWALLRRHQVEDVFGIQLCGSYPDTFARTAELIEQKCSIDFIDINVGCPIDIVVEKGAGSCLLTKPSRLEQILRVTSAVMENPLTLKVRTGYFEGRNCAHTLIPEVYKWGASAITIHGRTRQQRYSRLADWDYIYSCAAQAPAELQVIGNGDIFSFTDWNDHVEKAGSNLSTCMVARGALIKPWIFTEIKEQRHMDITSGERFEMFRDFVNFGLEHWGSDHKGVETTRRFLLEWLNYAHRYIPVGLLEVVPQKLNWRPPNYVGRNDLETLMASDSAVDWVRISEMLLGPVPSNFIFTPKHKSNAYDKAENG